MQKNAAGFSLLELMTTVAIIGIMASVAITNLSTSQRRQDAALEFTQLESLLREARNNARVRMRCVRVTITADSFEREEFEACDEAISLEQFKAPLFKRVALTPESFLFDENASIDRAGVIEIGASGSNYFNTLSVYPAIGTIRRQ